MELVVNGECLHRLLCFRPFASLDHSRSRWSSRVEDQHDTGWMFARPVAGSEPATAVFENLGTDLVHFELAH